MPEPDACLGPARKAAIEEVLTANRIYVAETNGPVWPTNLTLMDLSRLVSMADVLARDNPDLLTPARRDTLERATKVLREAVA